MEYENMRATELKALPRDRGLKNYSWMRKAELVALKMVQVEHLKLLRIRLWGCIIALLVPSLIRPN